MTNDEATTRKPRRSRTILLIAGAILVAFVGGFGWQYVRAERLESRLAEVEHELAFTRMEATLGAAALEGERGSYEPARRLTSEFYTQLQSNLADAPANARSQLEEILADRDQLITLLSRSDPEGIEMLTRTYVRYRIALRGPDGSLSVPATESEPADSPG